MNNKNVFWLYSVEVYEIHVTFFSNTSAAGDAEVETLRLENVGSGGFSYSVLLRPRVSRSKPACIRPCDCACAVMPLTEWERLTWCTQTHVRLILSDLCLCTPALTGAGGCIRVFLFFLFLFFFTRRFHCRSQDLKWTHYMQKSSLGHARSVKAENMETDKDRASGISEDTARINKVITSRGYEHAHNFGLVDAC